MIIRSLTFVLSLLYAAVSYAQGPPVVPGPQWRMSYGGSARDYGSHIVQTADGGYIMIGASESKNGDVKGNHGMMDYWVVKIKSDGKPEWQKALGGSGTDMAPDIIQTADRGYIIAGYTNSTDGDVKGNHGGYDYWIVKLNALGLTEWSKCLGGSGDDRATSVIQTAGGNYVVVGSTTSTDGDVKGLHLKKDAWVVKLGSTGAIIWQKCLGGSDDDIASCIQQDKDGNYIIGCNSSSPDGNIHHSHGSQDVWVVKLSPEGAIQWEKAYGGQMLDEITAITPAPDGGYLLTGFSNSIDGDVTDNKQGMNVWALKINAQGSIQWTKSFGGANNDRAYAATAVRDGGYLLAGWTNSSDGDMHSNHGAYDYWLIRITASGIQKWALMLGGSADDRAYSVAQTTDGGYIVSGCSKSNDGDVSGNFGMDDYWVMKLGADPKPLPAEPAPNK